MTRASMDIWQLFPRWMTEDEERPNMSMFLTLMTGFIFSAENDKASSTGLNGISSVKMGYTLKFPSVPKNISASLCTARALEDASICWESPIWRTDEKTTESILILSTQAVL